VVESKFNAFVKWLDRWRLLPVILNLMLVFKSVELSFFLALLLGPEPLSLKLEGHLSWFIYWSGAFLRSMNVVGVCVAYFS